MTKLVDLRNHLYDTSYLEQGIEYNLKQNHWGIAKQFEILYPSLFREFDCIKSASVCTKENLTFFLQPRCRDIFQSWENNFHLKCLLLQIQLHNISAADLFELQKYGFMNSNGKPHLSGKIIIQHYFQTGNTKYLKELANLPDEPWDLYTNSWSDVLPISYIFKDYPHDDFIQTTVSNIKYYVDLQYYLVKYNLINKFINHFTQGPMIPQVMDMKLHSDIYHQLTELFVKYSSLNSGALFRMIEFYCTEKDVHHYLQRKLKNNPHFIFSFLLPMKEKYLDYVLDRFPNSSVEYVVGRTEDSPEIQENILYIAKRAPLISLRLRRRMNYLDGFRGYSINFKL